MAENLRLSEQATKEEKYIALLPRIKALTEPEKNMIANLSNIVAALKYGFNFFWVGFYLVENDELVLGPFQGPIACTRIAFGKGVCGTAFAEKSTVVVPDVDQFPGHIACSSESRSEIVVPVIKNGEVVMVLDVDSNQLNSFDETDKKHLEILAGYVAELV